MNVYDFDKTIYAGDSTVDFYLYCLKKHPGVLLALPVQLWMMLKYAVGKCSKTEMKQGFYSFLKFAAVDDDVLDTFWDKHASRIRLWYDAQKQEDDVVISASPAFLLRPVCKRLGIAELIASEVDRATGRCLSPNCRGDEKVRRFQASHPGGTIDCFYSDSLSDQPLASLSRKAYLVDGEKLILWPQIGEEQ